MRIDAILHVAEQKLAAKFGTHIETGGGTMVQADWAQNDETAADYVKNRPGGYYGDPVTVDEEIYSGKIERALSEMEVDWLLVAGQTYKVTIGEVTKTYTAFADSFSGFPGVTIGDGTIEDAAKSGEMFALFSAEIEGSKSALLACPEADVGKTIRVTQFGTAREVHKIPAGLLDLDNVNKSMMQMSANIKELGNQHASDISSINKMLTEGPITFKRGSNTLKLGDYNANNGLMLRWDYGNGSYTYVYRDGLYVNNVSAGTSIGMNAYTINIVEKAHDSGIRFNLEKTDANGGTRFSVENVAGVRTTFYASGKIINSNKLLQLSANDTITEDNATTLRGVKTPEQDYDAANKKYVDQRLPSPATAQVGQIVKVKSVDESGKITETETVDMPTQKTLKWITVHSSDLTEETTEIVVSADPTGKAIADYNPVGLTLIISTPADATQTDNNGAPWVYPSATKKDNAIRVIGSIAGWKTTNRDSVFAFYGGSSAMTCTGNGNVQLATYKIDGYALDGVTAFLNGNTNHFPVGTHVEVAILCEVEE